MKIEKKDTIPREEGKEIQLTCPQRDCANRNITREIQNMSEHQPVPKNHLHRMYVAYEHMYTMLKSARNVIKN